jgi:hypothetical protein
MSRRREARIPERRAAMAIVRVRDHDECQFWSFVGRWQQSHLGLAVPFEVQPCHGARNGHELRKSSHYPNDYYDPAWITLLCNGHNEWVDDHNDEAVMIGLRIPTSQEEACP